MLAIREEKFGLIALPMRNSIVHGYQDSVNQRECAPDALVMTGKRVSIQPLCNSH